MKTPFIHVLGTGTSVPEAGNGPSSYWVMVGDKSFLIDAGPGIAQEIVNNGYHLEDIHTIFLTHIHSDHCLGIPEILFGLIHREQNTHHSINICVSSGYTSFIKNGLLKVWQPWFEKYKHITYQITPLVSGREFLIDEDVIITPFNVKHHASSLGLNIKTEDSSLSFTGDTDVFDFHKVEEQKPQILFLDSSTNEPRKIPGHLTVQEAVRLIENSYIPQVYLTHFMPGEKKKIKKYLKKIGQKGASEILIARKGEKIPL